MRQFVRTGVIASVVVGVAALADAQGQNPGAGQPGKAATKAAVPPRPAILDQVLATVNGETVTRGELYQILNATGVPPGADDDQHIYDVGIDGIVNGKLIKQYLKKQPTLVVTDKDVDGEFADFEKKLKADGQDIYVTLASYGITVPEVREQMKDRLRWVKYLDAVATEPNMKKFVADHKDYFNKTQVQASHIVVIVEPNASAADKEKARQKLLTIKKEIDSGKITFADAANKYSEDEGNKSSPRGGDLGYFLRKGPFNEQFTTAAFGMPKGKVSDPVETPFGYHLILVTDRREGPPIDFDQNKLLIKNEYGGDLQERIVASERKTAKIKVEPMPADLFPKGPPQKPAVAPGQPAGKAATPPPSTAAPR